MNDRLGKQGFVKGFLSLSVLIVVVFLVVSFGKPYYRYNTLRSHTKDLLATEIGNLQIIRERVLAEAEELHVPLDSGDLSVTIQGKIIKVKATWSETVDFWGYYQKQLDFALDVEY
ncbi:MAG: hypothetical protein HZA17_09065 [Nitrospirae bacterium]|nr:hypothetical protein [Nitrospirota bacterium]